MQSLQLKLRIDDLLDQMRKQGFSDSSLCMYRRHYRWAVDYCTTGSIDIPTLEDSNRFIAETMKSHPNEDPLLLRKTWQVLAEFCNSEVFVWRKNHYATAHLDDYYQCEYALFEGFLHNQPLADGSVEGILRTIRYFFEYLIESECHSIDEMSLKNINGFIMKESPSHLGNIGNIIWPLKRFLSYLEVRGKLPFDQIPQLPHPVCRRKKVLPCMSSDETAAILNAIDTSTALGKRDYAIILVAARTGMRISDILSLKLSSIRWDERKIELIQKKTGLENTIPLFTDVGNAIADYILNGRPKSNETQIFLSTKAPYPPLKPGGSRTGIIHRYQKLAGINRTPFDGKGFHAFRRAIGTNMISAGVSIEKTSQILGHESLMTAKRYISLDTSHLAECCLDMSNYQTCKEGLL